MTDNGVFSPGDTATILTDLFPGAITPLPPGVPDGPKLRVIITNVSLTAAWLAGRNGLEPIINRVDIALTSEETADVNHLGGQAGPYHVVRGSGCSCGAAGLKNWHPFPEVNLVNANRYQSSVNGQTGPVRYNRQ